MSLYAGSRPIVRWHRWGSLQGGSFRHGGRHFRLVVFPPGTNARERLWLRTWLSWHFFGFWLTLAAAVIADGAWVVAAVAVGAGVFGSGYVWLRHRVRRHRARVCILHAEYLPAVGAGGERRLCEQLIAYASIMAAAEAAADRGELAPVDFEHVWGLVHTEVTTLVADVADRPAER